MENRQPRWGEGFSGGKVVIGRTVVSRPDNSILARNAEATTNEAKIMTPNICRHCAHFRQFFGEQAGECFALPPVVLDKVGTLLPVPKIKSNRRSCGLFVLATETEIKSKKDPETFGDAAKLKRAAAAKPTQ